MCWFRQLAEKEKCRGRDDEAKKGTNTVTQGIWARLPPCSLPGRGAGLVAAASPGPQQRLQPRSSCPALSPGTTQPSPRRFYFRCFTANASQEKCFRKTRPCKAHPPSGATGKCSVSVSDTCHFVPPNFCCSAGGT